MEWPVPNKYNSPYDAQVDKEGKVWVGNMMDDRITRLDPTSAKTVQYLMPIETNFRRASVDDYGAKPVLWVGAQHQAVVMKVEPLE
jgi:streptogramin lyase